MKHINTIDAPAAIGPYSQAVVANNMLFTSGQIPMNPQTNELILDDIKYATELVMNNLKAILTEAGTSFDKVIKSSIFLKDMNDFAIVNEVYASFLVEGKFPARETVQVAKLPKDVQVEISMIVQL